MLRAILRTALVVYRAHDCLIRGSDLASRRCQRRIAWDQNRVGAETRVALSARRVRARGGGALPAAQMRPSYRVLGR